MRKLFLFLFTLYSAVAIAACGGGGGGNTTDGTTTQKTKAIVTLSTSVTGSIPAGTSILGYDVTITLPAGVTVKSTTNPPATDEGVVTATGEAAGALPIATYTPASGSAAGSVNVLLASGTAVNAGEFSAITCDIASGSSPAASDFVITKFSATGLDSGDSTVDLTSQLTATATTTFQ